LGRFLIDEAADSVLYASGVGRASVDDRASGGDFASGGGDLILVCAFFERRSDLTVPRI
jgi:hypothetical protein